MSAVTGLDCWDVLLTAASACCIQLLHDANDGVYIAVGYTLHGFFELERMLLSLLTGILSSHVTDKTQTDAVHLCADNPSSSAVATDDSAAVSSASIPQLLLLSESGGSKSGDLSVGTEACLIAAAIEPQLQTSSQQVPSPSAGSGSEQQSEASLQVSVQLKAPDSDTQLQTSLQEDADHIAENKTETVITRSGRVVKSKNFADYTLSETAVRDSASVEKTSAKQRRGRPRKSASSNCSSGIQQLDSVGQTSVINQQQDADVASATQQHVNEQQSHEAAASDMTTEHGTVIFL